MRHTNNIIYGCMKLGGASNWDESPLAPEQRKRALAALDCAVELGISSFDHADIYAMGKSEAIFGEFLRARNLPRTSFYIQSKAGIRKRDGVPFYDFSACHLRTQVLRSIERLNCDYLDRFLLHRPDMMTAPEEIAETLAGLLKEGLVRSVGVSNYGPNLIAELQSALPVKIEANQIPFNLLQTDPMDSEINFFAPRPFRPHNLLTSARQQGIEIQAYATLCRGLLESTKEEAWGRDLRHAREVCRAVAATYSCTVNTLLIAFVRATPFGIVPVVGTTDPGRLKEAVAASRITLERHDFYKLLEAGRPGFLP